MPGSNQRALEKAKTLAADCLILDLEDAVAPDAKVQARQQVLDAVNGGGYGSRELVIRVNALDTDWGEEDITAVAGSAADAICLPKVESAAEVEEVVRLLETAGARETLAIWVMCETPKGVLTINEIAGAHPRVNMIVMGTSDLAKDLRVRHTPGREGFMTSLGLCLLAARANNIDILDGVYLDLDDERGYLASCQQGRDLGFDGKTLIHPKQLAGANAAFGPSEEELSRAKKIIEAWRQAEAAGQGVVLVDGKLVENLHVDEAKRQLAIGEAIAAMVNA
jgi:citrate lyase subunit beta/citryl-CoA lyase